MYKDKYSYWWLLLVDYTNIARSASHKRDINILKDLVSKKKGSRSV